MPGCFATLSMTAFRIPPKTFDAIRGNAVPWNSRYELPINIPVASTSNPPTTTWRAAEKAGVPM